MRGCLFLVALWLLAVAGGARAAEPLAQPPDLAREAVSVPFAPDGPKLEAVVTRPSAGGRFPLIVLSHGTPREADERATYHPNRYAHVAVAFARRGWAVIAVVRRGYGRSGGDYAESSGSCGHRDYRKSAQASAADVLAAMRFMTRQPYVDATRIAFAGISAGGFASLAAAAQQPPGVVAVLNFAGGRGSDKPDSVCDADQLVETFGTLGKTVRIPTLWVYAANDHFFGPKLAQRFFTAFKGTGGTGEFVALSGFGEDGHTLFADAGIALWQKPVDRFLRANKLPTWDKPVAEKPAALKPPAGLSDKGRDGFANYLRSSHFEKAFAVGARGGNGWVTGRRTPEEAAHDALETCAKNTSGCRVYAINERLAR